MPAAQSLTEELRWATKRLLYKVFTRPTDTQIGGFPRLAQICEVVAPGWWRQSRSTALVDVMRVAISKLPDDKYPEKCSISWQAIALIVCGQREDIDPYAGDSQGGYDHLVEVARTEAQYPLAEDSFKQVTNELRKKLAKVLQDLVAEAERTGVTIDSPEYRQQPEHAAAAPLDSPSGPITQRPEAQDEPVSTEDEPEQPTPDVHRSFFTRRRTIAVGAGGLVLALAVGATLYVTTETGKASHQTTSPVPMNAQRDIRFNIAVIHYDGQKRYMVIPGYTMSTAERQRANKGTWSWDDAELGSAIKKLGVDIGAFTIQVSATNKTHADIAFTNIKPDLTARSAPLFGPVYQGDFGQADRDLVLSLNLDDVDPIVYESGGSVRSASPGYPYFADNGSIPLPKGGDAHIPIQVATRKYNASFRLIFYYTLNGTAKSTVVDNDGQPFRITAPHCGTAKGTMSYPVAYTETQTSPFRLVPIPNPGRIPNAPSGSCGSS